jgi:hypothetical protein
MVPRPYTPTNRREDVETVIMVAFGVVLVVMLSTFSALLFRKSQPR